METIIIFMIIFMSAVISGLLLGVIWVLNPCVSVGEASCGAILMTILVFVINICYKIEKEFAQ